MSNSVAYKILQDDIADSKKRDGQTTITLNQAKLKAERDALEAKSLSRLNELRAARGLAPVKKGDKIKDEVYDFVQEESLQIMIDLIKLGGVGEKSTKVASTIN
jgi:carboxyl-terminal processing protease